MFGSEEENKIALPNSMRIALITTNYANPDLPLKIQERVSKEKNKNLEFIFVDSVKDLFKYKETKPEETSKGLIDKMWINNLKNLIPSVIIFYYELLIGANKEPDEKVIYNILEQINNYSKNAIIFVILVSKDMKENPYYFNFNDRQKPYYLRNFLQKDKLYILPDDQIWNYDEFGEICTKIYNCSFLFYKQHHRNYKEKRTQAASSEEKIENNIKLAFLQRIKTKKKNFENSKYLEEAYELICNKNFDCKNYIYSSQTPNIRNNFYEIRAVGDWLFFKINTFLYNNNLNKPNIKSNTNINIYLNDINEKIKKCERHIRHFSNINLYDNGPNDYFHFVEYYWLSQRYKKLREYIEDNNIKIKLNKRIQFKWYIIIFKEIYNIIRSIHFYNKYFNQPEFKLTEIKLNNEKILDINNIEEEENNFYGKPPIYSYIDKENENKKEIIGFIDEIYIKKFIIKNQIKYNELIEKFKKDNFPNLCQFMEYFKNFLPNNKKESLTGINLYLNLLKNLGMNNTNIYQIDDIEFYSKIINDFEKIKKFPKVYINFVREYSNLIQRKLKEENSEDKNLYKKELFMALSILGNLTKLNPEEENLFYELLNDEKFTLDKQIIINLNYYTKNNTGIIKSNDLSINFRYDIKDINKTQKRKILDLIEYDLKFTSTLSKEKIKLNSIQLFFEYTKDDSVNKSEKISETILKTFNKEELSKFELDNKTPINIPYKLLIKYKDGQVSLDKIMFTFCKKENILYSINIPNEIDKTIFLGGGDVDILNFVHPNKILLSGVNQLFKLSYSVNKNKIDNIKIVGYKHIFSLQNEDENSIKNKIFGEQAKNNMNKLDEFLSINTETKIPPSMYYFDEEKNTMEEVKDNKNLEISYNNFESGLIEGKKNFDVLFKFHNVGFYLIKLDIKYKILQEEVNSDLEFMYSTKFYFKIINPISMSYNFQSNNIMLKTINNENNNNTQKKEFLTETPIKMNLILNNELKEDIIIKDIQMIPKDDNIININTTLKEIIDSKEIGDEIKEEILKISNSIQYIIPCIVNFKNPYNDTIGKFKIIWTTKSLKEYENNTSIKNNEKFNLLNESEISLPSIYVRKINFKLDYNYEIKDDNVIHLNIKIENKSKSNKKLFIQIGNNDETAFVISGLTNNFINLKNSEIKNLFLKLYVIQNGEIKLPDVIVKEFDYEGKEKSRNNFYSEKIILN